jgi:hypothetical protein
MRTLLAILILALPCAAMAADDYTLGSYWTVTSVDTKPGHFDDYMADLKRVWRKSLEMMKADGKVKSYTMFTNVNARHEEPDLWLLVEWTSGAALLDTPQEYWDAQTAKLFGSEDAGQAANIKRGDLRELLSNSLLREMSFTD